MPENEIHGRPLAQVSFSMAPKKLTQAQIVRLSQIQLHDAVKDWGLEIPSGALELEIRAMLARAVHTQAQTCSFSSAEVAFASGFGFSSSGGLHPAVRAAKGKGGREVFASLHLPEGYRFNSEGSQSRSKAREEERRLCRGGLHTQ